MKKLGRRAALKVMAAGLIAPAIPAPKISQVAGHFLPNHSAAQIGAYVARRMNQRALWAKLEDAESRYGRRAGLKTMTDPPRAVD